MKKIPFDEKEISIRYTIPNIRSASYADIPHFEAPLTAKENVKAAIFEKDCLYMPDFRDYLFFTPDVFRIMWPGACCWTVELHCRLMVVRTCLVSHGFM